MAGAALIGFFAGSGMWFTLLTLLAMRAFYMSTIEVLARIHFNYRQRHPRNTSPVRARRNTIIFWTIWASFMTLIALCHFLTQ
jgi:hypothetical protein